jgi:hypothetical protein
MSAVNPLSDSALQPAAEANDVSESSQPTQPWHAPPTLLDALDALEPEFDVSGLDFHDTIPAPPWLDEPFEAQEAPTLPMR